MVSGRSGGFDIFISYRRLDAAWVAGRIHDFLKIHFDAGRIFRDVEQLRLGVKFPKAIEAALNNCKVMLVIVGDKWLTTAYEDGRRRLDNPTDWVRIEIKTALERGILIVPIVVEGAQMPSAQALPDDIQSLVEFQGILDLSDKFFIPHMFNLLDTLKDIVELAGDKPYPHLDEIREIVRESLIESDDETLLEYMKDRLQDGIIKEYEQDLYYQMNFPED